MAETSSGIFSIREFSYRRNVLKLAPDAFITINDATTQKVVAPMEAIGSKTSDSRGGISTINVSCAVNPAGASRATIEVIAPQYKGLHEDYYITNPNGTRTNVFTPMMEIKIYMKGRFLEEEYKYAPRYYPVFWGMIVSVQENYASGAYTFTLTCEDLLCWWKYQKIALTSSVIMAFYGGAGMDRFPSVFKNMSPWEIIVSLFTDTFFMEVDTTGQPRRFNFVFPQVSNIYQQADIKNLRETWGPFSNNVIDYWNTRFGFGVPSNGTPQQVAASISNIPLEMYGMRGAISWDTIKSRMISFLDPANNGKGTQSDDKAKLDLDFGMLAKVQPYGLFDLYGDGSEPLMLSKLEIANAICEKVNMEFFVDTNGNFIFKPPLYNLDVATGNVPYYKVGPEEIINFNTNFDSNAIVNYLVVTGPLRQQLGLEAIGLHADFESIKKFGIRSDQIAISYGRNGQQLKMIAVAEMTRRNGQAYTASLSMPLRPEMRLGYPVYLPHIDTFYYVTGVSHSYTYGSAATTDLSLQYRRERVFEDGTSSLPNSTIGDVLDRCVMRERDSADVLSNIASNDQLVKETQKSMGLDVNDPGYKAKIEQIINEQKKDDLKIENRIYSGPNILGYWGISKAEMVTTGNTVKNPDRPDAIESNELVMITDKTVPYTDKNGYRHIGAFPFGANLIIMKNGKVYDSLNHVQSEDSKTAQVVDATGSPETTSVPYYLAKVSGQPSTDGTPTDTAQTPEYQQYNFDKRMNEAQTYQETDITNPQKTPQSYISDSRKQGKAYADATYVDVGIILNAKPPAVSPGSTPASNVGGPRQVQLTM